MSKEDECTCGAYSALNNMLEGIKAGAIQSALGEEEEKVSEGQELYRKAIQAIRAREGILNDDERSGIPEFKKLAGLYMQMATHNLICAAEDHDHFDSAELHILIMHSYIMHSYIESRRAGDEQKERVRTCLDNAERIAANEEQRARIAAWRAKIEPLLED